MQIAVVCNNRDYYNRWLEVTNHNPAMFHFVPSACCCRSRLYAAWIEIGREELRPLDYDEMAEHLNIRTYNGRNHLHATIEVELCHG